jgi:hypothetical protein
MKAIAKFIREWISYLPKAILILILVIITCLIIVTASAFIPSEKMTDNIIRSTELLVSEGNWNFVDPAQPTSKIDNFTDSLLLQIAWMPDDEPPAPGLGGAVKRGVYNGYYYCHGENIAAVGTLQMICDGRYDECAGEYYARYWLGGAAVLRLLLCFVSYGEIRFFLGALTIFMTVIAMALVMFPVGERFNDRSNTAFHMYENLPIAFALILSALFVNPKVWTHSMQLTIVWLICSFFSVIYMCRKKKERDPYYYLLLGATVSFFDFLTYPLVPLGLILLTDLWVRRKDSALKNFALIIGHSAYWCLGYFGNWAGKWVLASIILKRNLILEGLRDTKVRISLHSGGLQYTLTDVYRRNFSYLSDKRIIIPFLILLALLICVAFITGRKRHYSGAVSMNGYNMLNILFVTVLYPVIWYTVLSNHSWEHDWITYRELSILVFGLMLSAAGGICILLDRHILEKQIDKKR